MSLCVWLACVCGFCVIGVCVVCVCVVHVYVWCVFGVCVGGLWCQAISPFYKMPNATLIGLFPTGTLVRKKGVRRYDLSAQLIMT